MVKNPPTQCRGHGFEPMFRKIPPAAGPLRTTTEPVLTNCDFWACVLSCLCTTTREAIVRRNPCTATGEQPPLAQLEKACTQQQRPNAAKNKKVNLNTSWASQVVLEVMNMPASTGDMRDVSSIPGLGRSLGGGHGYSLQCSCLEKSMDREAWRATVHQIPQSQTQLKRLSM